jgi:ankyrin repeat protein
VLKWTIHHFYNQYLYTLWLAFLLLTSCNTNEIAPATLQANLGILTIDTIQANSDRIGLDTTHFTELLLEGIYTGDFNELVLSKMSGAPVGAPDKNGDIPLIAAVKDQNIEAVYYLIQQGADINQKNQAGYAPLHHAARDIEHQFGEDYIFDPCALHILCSYRADVNIPDHEGNTPLHHAILAYADYQYTPQENYTLQKERIQILLEAGARLLPNNKGNTPLALAKSVDRSDIVALLEKEGIIQPSIPSLATLSKEKLVNYLLSPSNEAQKQAILQGRFDIDLAEKDNIRIDTNFAGSNKLIHLATKARNLSMIKFLLQYDPSQINYTNLIDQTPLHIAAENGYTDIAEHLVQYPKINLNALSIGGYNPLHYAIIHGHNYVLGCLVQAKANVDVIAYPHGKTPLHYAAENGSFPAAWFLVQNGININARDSDGKTPLHNAAYSGSLSLVQYLLQNGANINARNNSGETPLDIAVADEQSDIIEYLVGQEAEDDFEIDEDEQSDVEYLLGKDAEDDFEIDEIEIQYQLGQGTIEREQSDNSVEDMVD